MYMEYDVFSFINIDWPSVALKPIRQLSELRANPSEKGLYIRVKVKSCGVFSEKKRSVALGKSLMKHRKGWALEMSLGIGIVVRVSAIDFNFLCPT
jgi:hypothetical protein